jgi:hypothetical protein
MPTKKAIRLQQNRVNLREKYWPEVREELLWSRNDNKGFTTIPRGLSIVTKLMDSLSPGKPLTGTYFALWCYGQDEMVLTLRKPRQMALESGFSGQRAEYTWKTRMGIIENFGFIKSKHGFSGRYHYILLLNPYLIVESLKKEGRFDDDVQEQLYNTLLERIEEIGEKTEIS